MGSYFQVERGGNAPILGGMVMVNGKHMWHGISPWVSAKVKEKNQKLDYIYGAVESKTVESKWQVNVQMEHVDNVQSEEIVPRGKGQSAKVKARAKSVHDGLR